MDREQALNRMIAPGTKRPGKWRQGVIQVWVTRACDKACFGCTQGSNLGGKPGMITVDQFRTALLSLRGYFGVVGMFGGNPATHPQFKELCAVMREIIPFEQRGLWSNNPMTLENAQEMRKTFNPAYSNLNVHLDKDAYDLFKRGWPECHPFGLDKDSRHSPVHLAMKDIIQDESVRWSYIADCDINKHWSAMIGVFRGQVRAWFCEIAGAQSILMQDDPHYPDTGVSLYGDEDGSVWWKEPMHTFCGQVDKHCHECAVPLKGHGELACAETGIEQTSKTYEGVFKPKRKGRAVELVTVIDQIRQGRINKVTDYLGNANRV